MMVHRLDQLVPEQLPITESALLRAIAYAQLVAEEREGVECIGYLLADAHANAWQVTDVLLAPCQTATLASVLLDGHGVLTAAREIQRSGKRAVGWWHSHNTMETFHSPVDVEYTARLLAELAPSNSRQGGLEVPLELRPAGGLTAIRSRGRTLATLPAADLAPFSGTAVLEVQLSAIYSLVVNVFGETYAEVAYQVGCGFCRGQEVKRRQVALRVLRGPHPPTLPIAALREEVRRKVRLMGLPDRDAMGATSLEAGRAVQGSGEWGPGTNGAPVRAVSGEPRA